MPALSSSYPMTILDTATAVNRRPENKKVPVSLTWQKTDLSPVSKSKIDHPPLRRAQGTFPLLSQRPPAVTRNAPSTRWNEMYNQQHAFEITSFGQARQGQDDNDSVRSHMKALSFHRDHKPQEGQEGPTRRFPQTNSGSDCLILQMSKPSLHFISDMWSPLIQGPVLNKARVFVTNSLLKDQNLPQSSRDVTGHSLYSSPSHVFWEWVFW